MPRFKDHPEFTPNLTPQQMFKKGSFGGTYWRPIKSSITGKKYKNKHNTSGPKEPLNYQKIPLYK